jgi:uncharacterized protein
MKYQKPLTEILTMKHEKKMTRRGLLQGLGVAGTGAILASAGTAATSAENNAPLPADTAKPPMSSSAAGSDARKAIFQKVEQTPLIDTHEHLCPEKNRLGGNDWLMMTSHYLNGDFGAAGMPGEMIGKLYKNDLDLQAKWKMLEPYWPAVKYTGYGQAVRISVRKLYDIDEISGKTMDDIQSRYTAMLKPGFYRHILRDVSNIESCQINSMGEPFLISPDPDLLMYDLNIWKMHAGPNIEQYSTPAQIKVTSLSDWHRVMDWWFEKYGKLAVAAKSQGAWSGQLDYPRRSAEEAAPIFAKKLAEQKLTDEESKNLEGHLFWYAVEKATAINLPVKIHTGYTNGDNWQEREHFHWAAVMCQASSATRFVFMHICYPYYENMVMIPKVYPNAYVDMCWSWIVNPMAAKDFLKKYLVTAPANKIFTFGGDYWPIEPVVGHAALARRGIALALSELTEEGWISLDEAMRLADMIMHKNARQFFHLKERNG